MNNSQRAIMMGAGLFIAVIIVAASLLIITKISNEVDKLFKLPKELQQEITSNFDGKIVKGSDVIAACKKYENSEVSIVICISEDVSVYTGKYKLLYENIKDAKTDGNTLLTTQAYEGGVYYIENIPSKVNNEKIEVSELEAENTNTSISSESVFYSSIIKDNKKDNVIGIVFVQEEQTNK